MSNQDLNDVQQKMYMAVLANMERALHNHPRLHYAMRHHRNIRNELMRFEDKPYLVAIYMDNAPEIVLKSSVQTGKSEFLIVSAHSWAEEKGLQILYTLPTAELRNLFVANRVDKLYEMAPHYREQIQRATGVSNSRSLKHFGDKGGAIFFAGSNSATTFIEKPIDLVIGDEIDRFDLANYAKADDRMTASPYKLKYEASNPTVDKFGIDRRWRESDQRDWFVKCPSCNYWQEMDWWKNVVYQTDDNEYLLRDKEWDEYDSQRDIHVYCIRCGKPLDRFTQKSCWVSKFPKIKDTHGYHIHQMLSNFVAVRTMWKKFNAGLNDDTEMQVFYNSVLGLTYAGKGSKLTDEILNACKERYLMPMSAENCFMGVDVGKRLHVVIFALAPGGKFRLVFAGTVREFEELDYLMARYNIVSYAIDVGPETRKTLEYVKKYFGKGWAVRYTFGLKEITTNEDERIASADRTMLMDRVLKYFMDRRFILPANAQSLDRGNFYEEMKTPTRIYVPEKERYEWVGDPDHYYHATLYAMVAYLVRGEIRVVGLDIQTSTELSKPVPDTFDKAVTFAPGTPEHLIEHYKRLYERSKNSDTINIDNDNEE